MADGLFAEGSLALLQGWHAPGSLDVSAAFLRAGGWALPRVEAFPDPSRLKARLHQLTASMRDGAKIGLDLRGLRDGAEGVLAAAREAGVAFLLHAAELPPALEALRQAGLPRIVAVMDEREAAAARAQGASAFLAPAGKVRSLDRHGLPTVAISENGGQARQAMDAGARGLQPRSPALMAEDLPAGFAARMVEGFDAEQQRLFREGPGPLPGLRIRNLNLTYPIQQGGMGVGVSWEGLAGAVAREGCVGLVSAIGTGYHPSARVPMRLGRPDGTAALNPSEALETILQSALARAGGRGAVGVNILCAIEGYEATVRASVAAGAQLIVSGAGLPLALPDFVGDAEVALVPLVSSARALGVICRQWQRKHGRLPDAAILEGPESGGHQGFSAEQCGDPAFTLENLLPGVLAERDKWGGFPILVAGGVWDRQDIQRFLAMGASGVQMGTRFIGTFECDAHANFKETILKAKAEDIVLMGSPVGMPARGVRTSLQARMASGTAPQIRCVSRCLTPCGQGRGAAKAGYCIADRLADAWHGDKDSGLFFSGSNGSRLKEILSVRDLIEELTQDPGLQSRYAS
jgi:nitronate monooxygenase